MKKKINQNSGFTLIELLIVIAVMAILTGIVFVALNPLARFQDSRNVRRWMDVNAIVSAIKLHQIDNKGVYLETLNTISNDLVYQIGQGSACSFSCPGAVLQTACVDVEGLSDLGYIASLPFDPNISNPEDGQTHYYLIKHSEGMITVGACDEELGSGAVAPTIAVTR